MIKIENFEVVGWEHAVRGMRNPKNSWGRSDSVFKEIATTQTLEDGEVIDYSVLYDALSIGEKDHILMNQLNAGGPVHAKYRRMITVYVDITAPLYWWKEFDTYKVGTVANSCSTMHKIHDKEFTLDDFSHEHLIANTEDATEYVTWDIDNFDATEGLQLIINLLNRYRYDFLDTKDKKYWWQIIQLLPSSYNQKRTIMLNYEVLVGIYKWRKNHKLDEWREFCQWIEELPYSELITGTEDES